MATILGSTGNDTLIGTGNDTVIRSETQSELTFTVDDSGNFFVSGASDGTDKLIGIEQIVTANGHILITGPQYITPTVGVVASNPSVTNLTGGGYVVTWQSSNQAANDSGYDIYAQRFDANGTKVGNETLVNFVTAADQVSPSVAGLANGGFVVVWQSLNQATPVSDYDIYAQRFDANGAKIGNETLVNVVNNDETITRIQSAPAIAALNGGGYVVTWHSNLGTNSDWNVYAQRFDSTGNKVGSETLINSDPTTSGSSQEEPSITSMPSGNHYMVTWQSNYQDWDVYVKRLNNDGTLPSGTDTLVSAAISAHDGNTSTYENINPTISTLTTGGYVVTWQCWTSNGYDIYAKLFDANNTIGNETLLVNSVTASAQEIPSVAGLANGGFVVVWQSLNQAAPDSDYDIYAQRFDANGAKVGNEMLVNLVTVGTQNNASVTGLSNGGYVITWQSTQGVGGIYSQPFDADGKAIYTFTAADESLSSVINVNTESTALRLHGNAGNDLFSGGNCNDLLISQAGNDTLVGGLGNDTLVGGTGNDTYVVDNVADVLTEAASEGTDTVQSSLSWTLGAELENLTLTGTTAINGTGNSTNNVITGNSAANVLDGGAGADILVGGAGDDTYVVDTTGDVVTELASEGTDTIQSSITWTLGAELENLMLTGAAAINGTGNSLNNAINGNSAANSLSGAAGNDTLNGGTGADTLLGGLGDDTYVVDSSLDVVTEAASEGTDTVQSNLTWALGAELENLTLTGAVAIDGTGNSANNAITGNSAANVLDGGAGADSLVGGAGNDTLKGGTGNDTLDGGDGADYASYSVASGAVSVDLVSGTASGAHGNDSLIAIENISGTGYNDAIYGNSADNYLAGNAGNDTLRGNAGNDTLNGGDGVDTVSYSVASEAVTVDLVGSTASGADGADVLYNLENVSGSGYNDAIYGNSADNNLVGNAGNDTLRGNAGNDTLNGGDGVDMVSYAAASGTVTVDLVGGLATGADGSDALYNLENVSGSGYNDAIYGNSAANYLVGNAGNDTLRGNAGNDTLDGGAGTDMVSYAAATAAVVVNLTAGTASGGDGADTLYNLESISGSAYADSLMGNSAANLLVGNAGNDTLNGRAGADTLTGGTGSDTFVFGTLAEMGLGAAARDVITDFSSAQGDRIDLSSIDANASLGGDQAFAFVASFTATAGQVRYSGGVVYLNTDADVDAEYEIALTGVVPASLAAADFLL